MLESAYLMQQHNFDALIQEEEEEEGINKLGRVEVVQRYIFASPPYY